MKPALVQMSTREWTMQAVHLACAIARNNGTHVILLRLIPVGHAGYLGTAYGHAAPTAQEEHDVCQYLATAEDYGVTLNVRSMQCITLLDAVVDAAKQLDVDIVFAHVLPSRIVYWQKFQVWMLERRLSTHHRQLFTLIKNDMVVDQIPYVVTTPASSSTGR